MYAYKWWIVCGGRLRFAEAASRIWKYFKSFKSPTLNDASHLTLQQSFSFFTTTTAVNHLLETFTVNPLPAISTYYISRIHRFWLGFGSVDRWAPFRTPGNLHWCSSSIDTKFFSALAQAPWGPSMNQNVVENMASQGELDLSIYI